MIEEIRELAENSDSEEYVTYNKILLLVFLFSLLKDKN